MSSTTCLLISESSAVRSYLAGLASPGLFSHWFSAQGKEEALALIEREPIDLILVGTGEIFDQDSLRELCLRALAQETPLVVCGTDDTELDIQALEAGAADSLPGNISPREAGLRLRRQIETKKRLDRLRREREELSRQALTDSLTGLGNHRFFQQRLAAEGARSERNGEPFSLMMIDMDYFKKINDTFGHPVGDQVLQKVAEVLRHGLRRSDVACRIGGEEFVLLLPETTAENAKVLAAKLRQKISVSCRDILPREWRTTVSIGISCARGPGNIDLERLQTEADHALYAAKAAGRNRTVCARPADPLQEPLFPSRNLRPHPAGVSLAAGIFSS